MNTGVGGSPEPRRQRPGFWAASTGAGVLVLLMVVGLAGDRDGAGRPATTAEPGPPAATGPATMPELVGRTEWQALAALRELEVPTWHLRYRHDPDRADTVLSQSVPPGTPVEPAPPVSLVVAVALPAPVPVSPSAVPVLSHTAPLPTVTWDPVDSPVPRWRVTVSLETCQLAEDGAVPLCRFPEPGLQAIVTRTPSFTIHLSELLRAVTPELDWLLRRPNRVGYHTGWIRWQVEALDHFGNLGPAGPYSVLLISVVGG